MSAPIVSVLLPVRNGEAHLGEAIRSVLAQTFTDWELVIVDDGSTDSTRAIIDAFDDPRVRVVERAGGKGLAAALNHGVQECRGRFIARLDADDRCHPDRFEKQVARLRAEPGLGALGSAAIEIDEHGTVIGERRAPVGHASIMQTLRWRSVIIHPSAMLRRETLDAVGGYRPVAERYEDLDLWLRIAATGAAIDNLDEALLDYRIHSAQVTARNMLHLRPILAIGHSRIALARAHDESVLVTSARHLVWFAWQGRRAVLGRLRPSRRPRNFPMLVPK